MITAQEHNPFVMSMASLTIMINITIYCDEKLLISFSHPNYTQSLVLPTTVKLKEWHKIAVHHLMVSKMRFLTTSVPDLEEIQI